MTGPRQPDAPRDDGGPVPRPVPPLEVPRYASPFLEAELDRAGLSDARRAQVQAFARDGYLVFDPEIADLGGVATAIERALEPEHATSGNRITDAWRSVPEIGALAANAKVVELIEDLYGRAAFPFQTLNFLRGSEQRTHSDLIHFASLPTRFVAGVWIALEDVGPDNGPLHYYPGSHLLPPYEIHELGIRSSVRDRPAIYARYEDFLEALVAAVGLERTTVEMRRGQALVWAGNLLHGGDPIRDAARTRRTQVTHYYFRGCRYYTPLYSDPPRARYSWSKVFDIRTGRSVPHQVAGADVRLPLTTTVRYLAQHKLGQSSSGRRLVSRAKQRIQRGR